MKAIGFFGRGFSLGRRLFGVVGKLGSRFFGFGVLGSFATSLMAISFAMSFLSSLSVAILTQVSSGIFASLLAVAGLFSNNVLYPALVERGKPRRWLLAASYLLMLAALVSVVYAFSQYYTPETLDLEKAEAVKKIVSAPLSAPDGDVSVHPAKALLKNIYRLFSFLSLH